MSGAAESETTDGTGRRSGPGDLVLLEDTSGRGHVTGNIGDGYATFLVVPVSAARDPSGCLSPLFMNGIAWSSS
jgi:hypothetical protein